MEWLADLTSALGLPGGGATLAVAIYTSSVAVEKAARQDALADISKRLENLSHTRMNEANSLINKLLIMTFGERHFSKKCILRSVLGSTLFVIFFVLLAAFFYSKLPHILIRTDNSIFGVLSVTIWVLFISDFVSLARTRILAHYLRDSKRLSSAFLLTLLDILFAIGISYVATTIAGALDEIYHDIYPYSAEIIENQYLIGPLGFLDQYLAAFTMFRENVVVLDQYFSPSYSRC